jgi:hypothetical protein
MAAYPGLQQKIDVIRKKYPFDAGDISSLISKDKSTAWRWLRGADALEDEQQRSLVAAICKKFSDRNPKLQESMFWENDLPTFCCEYIGLTKLEAAIFLDRGLPVPDVFVDSVFQPDPSSKFLLGSYLLFRHDKERTKRDRPYLQAVARIGRTKHGLVSFEDFWAGDGDHNAQAYDGFVIIAGQSMNIIGQRRRSDPDTPPQLFWQGLRRIVGKDGIVHTMYGYVSDFYKDTLVIADRMVMIRSDENELTRVEESREFYIDGKTLERKAGDKMRGYLDDWKDISITDPFPKPSADVDDVEQVQEGRKTSRTQK